MNLLRANSLYNWSFDLDAISRMIRENPEEGGG